MKDQPETLPGGYHVDFGMTEKEVVKILADRYELRPLGVINREAYSILEFGRMGNNYVDKLRVFIHPIDGVYWIEAEIFLHWDLQKEDRDNLEFHQKQLSRVLRDLRDRYGEEALLATTNMGDRFRENDFVTATWRFPNNRWIHVIFEPQDWSISPELNKIVIIYRDAEKGKGMQRH